MTNHTTISPINTALQDHNTSILKEATGKVDYTLTNDYLFRAVLQQSNNTLKGLICFLDFTLFPQEPAFFSTYMFTNIKTHTIYSDKLRLSVVDLTQIEQATDEDRLYGLYDWAKLFKSTTWEEIKMLVANNKNLEEAAATAYQLTSDEEIRLQCEARRDYLIHEQYIQKKIAQYEQENALFKQELAQARQETAQYKQESAQYKQESAQYKQESAQYKQAYEELLQKYTLLMEKGND